MDSKLFSSILKKPVIITAYSLQEITDKKVGYEAYFEHQTDTFSKSNIIW